MEREIDNILSRIIAIVLSGSQDTLTVLKKVESRISEQYSKLQELFELMSTISNVNKELPRPRSIDYPIYKSIKIIFQSASIATSFYPEKETTESSNILTCISKCVELLYRRSSIRKRIVKLIRISVEGTTEYHWNILCKKVANLQNPVFLELLSQFKSYHLVDSIQPKINEILYFTLFIDDLSPQEQQHIPPLPSPPLKEPIHQFHYNLCSLFKGGPVLERGQKSPISPRSPRPLPMIPLKIPNKGHSLKLSLNKSSPEARKKTLPELLSPRLQEPGAIRQESPKGRRAQVTRSRSLKNTTIGPPWKNSPIISEKVKITIDSPIIQKKSAVSYPLKPTLDLILDLDSMHGEFEKEKKGSYSARPHSAKLQDSISDDVRSYQKYALPRKRLIARCHGYWLEQGHITDPHISEDISLASSVDDPALWFNTYFLPNTYDTYISSCAPEGNVIVNVKKEKEDKTTRIRLLYRSSERTIGLLVPISQLQGKLRMSGKTHVLKRAFALIDPLIGFKTFQKCESENIHTNLQDLQKLELVTINQKTEFKFGVLNWQEGNRNEEDMFSNQTISPDFEEFLNLLGDKVPLIGRTAYSGGLDTSVEAESGEYSIFTNYDSCDIMFHVAPYLPFSQKNSQQLARKKHIGNDVALIIFNEASRPYLTSLIASQFNHIIIVVSPEETGYSVAVTAKETVPPFGPSLPPQGRFRNTESLRNFLLTKLITGERAASKAPAFLNRLAKSRELLLRCFVDNNYVSL